MGRFERLPFSRSQASESSEVRDVREVRGARPACERCTVGEPLCSRGGWGCGHPTSVTEATLATVSCAR